MGLRIASMIASMAHRGNPRGYVPDIHPPPTILPSLFSYYFFSSCSSRSVLFAKLPLPFLSSFSAPGLFRQGARAPSQDSFGISDMQGTRATAIAYLNAKLNSHLISATESANWTSQEYSERINALKKK